MQGSTIKYNYWNGQRWFSRIRDACNGAPNTAAYILVAGAVVLWASWPALATIAYPAPPFLVLGMSALIGFVFSFLISVVNHKSTSFFAARKRTLLFVAFGLMGNNAFYLAAITRIGPAEANVVHYLWPVFLLILASFIHRRKPTLVQVIGITAGFIGVAVALAPSIGLGLDVTGVMLGVCGALTFAIYSVVRSLARAEQNVVGPSLGLAGVAALVAHFATEQLYWPSANQWIAITLMGIGPFTVANILWDKATRVGSTAIISSLAFLTPLVAIALLAAFGLGTVQLATVLGACLVIAGTVMAARS
ncbi:DMT family transporter [Granulosicoccus sp.]|nr:DMT family transporter [Granulosicoccus sp.]MDB4222768.1 DMT family transporter [Granulosicoccus sp.]